MLDGRHQQAEADDVRLPFEPRTILADLWLRRWHFLSVLVAALGIGAWVGILAGQRTYTATTLLRYTTLGDAQGASASFSLQNELNQVKLIQNLSKVRERLGLASPLESVGRAVSVSGGRDASLLSIKATWDDPVKAADLANTVRDVYMETWLEGQIVSLDRMRSQTKSELATLDTQAERLGALIEGLRQQAAQEQAQAEKTGDVSARYQKLREAIQEDQSRRANMAEMGRRAQEMERARAMRAEDLISPAEYDRSVAAYRASAAVAVDTAKVKEWRAEMDQMAEAMQASPAEQSTPTLGLLNTTLLKSFDLDLQRVAMSRKMDELANAGDRIREAIGATRKHEPGEFAAPAEATRDESRQSVQEVLGAVLPAYGTGGVLLDVVADAQPPVFPEKSTRKKLAIAAALGIFLLGAIGVGWRPILCPSARSAAELALRARVQVLGSLPRVPHVDLWSPLKPGTPLVEARRLLADRVRSVLPGEGIRILLTSPGPNDGRTLVATHLATALGLRGERVMLVDACVREPRPQVGLESLVTGSPSARGLGEFLSGDDVPLLDLARCTGLGRVLLVPRGRALESPEPLGSTRMKTLLGDASRAGSVVIVVGDPLLRRVDAELVARSCNATILAVRAGRTHVSDVRRAIKRMSEAGAPVIGAVLVAVREPFMEID